MNKEILDLLELLKKSTPIEYIEVDKRITETNHFARANEVALKLNSVGLLVEIIEHLIAEKNDMLKSLKNIDDNVKYIHNIVEAEFKEKR
jgi:hypothetical protein